MTRDELNAIRWRLANVEDSINGNFPWDCRALLAYVDRLLAVVAAADAWLAGHHAHWTDTTEEAEAYRAARKSLEGT